MSDLQVANTIRNQILAGGRMKVMSWGVSNWVGTKDALSFRVRGHHFKGYVKVILTSMDDYTIQFISTHGNVKKEITKILFDQGYILSYKFEDDNGPQGTIRIALSRPIVAKSENAATTSRK